MQDEELSTPQPLRLRLARTPMHPLRALWRRVVLALGLLALVIVAVWLDRDGYRDSADGSVSFLDACYYATVTLSTTGYGDIIPVSERARLLNVLLVTPARVLFVIVLVGTTLEVLTERSRELLRAARWRRTVNDHVVVCGYGTKGRSAVRTLREQGVSPKRIVVVDPDSAAVAEASSHGVAAICGSSTRSDVLREAQVQRARVVVVAVNRDDTAILTTLTARELAPKASISVSVRESENAHLLRQSGADSVITSSEAVGRLLGLSVRSAWLIEVVEDLLSAGKGLEIAERPVDRSEIGGTVLGHGERVIAVVRDGRLLRFGTQPAEPLREGDRVVCVRSHPGGAGQPSMGPGREEG